MHFIKSKCKISWFVERICELKEKQIYTKLEKKIKHCLKISKFLQNNTLLPRNYLVLEVYNITRINILKKFKTVKNNFLQISKKICSKVATCSLYYFYFLNDFQFDFKISSVQKVFYSTMVLVDHP